MPYKGAGPALNDLMGGQVDLLCDQTTQTAPVIKDGTRVKVFGVTTPKRLATHAQHPDAGRAGPQGLRREGVARRVCAQGHAARRRSKLNVALRAALQDDMVKHRLAELSSEIVPLDKQSRRKACARC